MELEGVEIFESLTLTDVRGSFQKTHFKGSPSAKWSTVSEVFFTKSSRGTIRGFHLQWGACSSFKAVKCLDGEILDVLVDLRPQSKTYLGIKQITLRGFDQQSLFIPPGVGHGYQVISDSAFVYYATNKDWCEKCDVTVNPLSLNLNWPIDDAILSNKDKMAPKLEEFLLKVSKNGGVKH